MLLNFDHTQPIYLIGGGVVAREFRQNLNKEGIDNIIVKDFDQWHEIPSGSQCILGFLDLKNRIKCLTPERIERYRWPSYVHPSSVLENPNDIGKGVWIYSLCNICFETYVGDFTVMASLSSIGHGTRIGKHNFLGAGTQICGSVTTGDNVFFGVRSTIKDRISICSNTSFYMTSTITRDITESGEYYGNKKATLSRQNV